MRKQTSNEIENEVKQILKHNREYTRRKLIGFIERIEYLEGKEFYDCIKENILKSFSTLPKAKEHNKVFTVSKEKPKDCSHINTYIDKNDDKTKCVDCGETVQVSNPS